MTSFLHITISSLTVFNIIFLGKSVDAAFEAVKILSGEPVKNKVKIVPADIITPANAKDHYYPDSAY